MTIRTATFDDLDEIVDLARLYHDEGYQWIAFDAAHARETIRARAIDTMDGICLLMLGDDGKAIGLLAGVVAMLPSAPVPFAAEMIWYVKPAHRGRGWALLDEFEKWAKWKGCAFVTSACRKTDDERRDMALNRLYERKGYALQELGHVKVI